MLKISPDNINSQLLFICKLLIKYKIDGVIATNTTLSRTEVSKSKKRNESGGLSGLPLRSRSLKTLKFLKLNVNHTCSMIHYYGWILMEKKF